MGSCVSHVDARVRKHTRLNFINLSLEFSSSIRSKIYPSILTSKKDAKSMKERKSRTSESRIIPEYSNFFVNPNPYDDRSQLKLFKTHASICFLQIAAQSVSVMQE